MFLTFASRALVPFNGNELCSCVDDGVHLLLFGSHEEPHREGFTREVADESLGIAESMFDLMLCNGYIVR